MEGTSTTASTVIPSFLICPMTRDVFTDPYIAADGITYEKAAIECWLRSHDTSPSFDVPLSSRALVPNLALRSALDWHKNRISQTEAIPRAVLVTSAEEEPDQMSRRSPSRRDQALALVQARFHREGWGPVQEGDLKAFLIDHKEEYHVPIRAADDRFEYGNGKTIEMPQFGFGNKAVIANPDVGDAFVTTKGFQMYYWRGSNKDELGLPTSDEYLFGDGSKQEFARGYTIWTPSSNCYHKIY